MSLRNPLRQGPCKGPNQRRPSIGIASLQLIERARGERPLDRARQESSLGRARVQKRAGVDGEVPRNGLERDGGKRGGALEGGGAVDGVVGVEVECGGGERRGGVGADGSAGDGLERGRWELVGIFRVDFGGWKRGQFGAGVAERMAQIF